MNTSNEQKSIASSENAAAKGQTPGVNNSEPQFTIPGPLPEAKPATQEILHLTPQQGEPVGPVKQAAATDAVVVPPLAAQGDSAAMDQPEKQS